jgi:hypothetical protein
LDVEDSDIVIGSHGSLWRLPTSGGTIVEIASGVGLAMVDIEDGYVYTLSALGAGRVRRVPVTGGSLTDLTDEVMNGTSIDVDGSTVFWSAGFRVGSVGITGTGAVDYGGVGWAGAIAGHQGYAYFSDINFHKLLRAPVNGGSSETLQDGVRIMWLADNDQDLFYATDDGTLGRIDGTTLVPLTSTAGEASDLSADATHVYWIDDSTGEIKRIPIAGGSVEVFEEAEAPQDIVATDEYVYWVTDSEVYRKPK